MRLWIEVECEESRQVVDIETMALIRVDGFYLCNFRQILKKYI